jgi:hypothetical protein
LKKEGKNLERRYRFKCYEKFYYENENIWASQKMIAELYGVEVNTINYHLKQIFSTSSFPRKWESTLNKLWKSNITFILSPINLEGLYT